MTQALDEIVLALAERLLDEGLVDRSPESVRLEEELQEAGADALPFWLALLENEAPECRFMAAFNLGRLATTESGPLPDDAIGALARHALEDPEPKIRRESAAAVLHSRGGGAAALLQAVAEDPAEDVAGWAAQARESLEAGAGASAPRIPELVDYDVDARIARALMTGVPADEPPAGFVAATPHNLAARRAAAAFAARVAAEPDARDLVDTAALALFVRDDPDPEVRRDAARALDALVPPEPAPGVPFVRWLRDRGYLRASDLALLRLASPLTAAPGGGETEPHVRAILLRLTGAERMPQPWPAPAEEPAN